jgi:hypothetical protein
VPHPPPRARHLSFRQRELVRWVRLHGAVRAAKVPTHRDGYSALRRLEDVGLVTRDDGGWWHPGEGRP